MSESECIFSKLTWLCKGGSGLVTAHKTRLINIILCSRQRKDLLHIELEESLENNKDFSVKCHSSCVSSYTSRFHLKRAVSSSDQFPGEVEPSSSKRLCRSSLSSFEFKKQCLFCGDEAKALDPRHPDRHKTVIRCATAEESGGFKKINSRCL